MVFYGAPNNSSTLGSSNHANEAAKYQNSRNMDLHDYTCSSHGRLQLFGFALQQIPTSVCPETPLQDSLMPMVIRLQLAKPEANDYINSRHVREMVHAQFTELSHAGLTLAFKFFHQDIITSSP